MPNYLFTGNTARFYPNIVGGSGSLIAEPGDVLTFDEPPTDGLWIETDAPEVIPEPRTWPPARQPIDATVTAEHGPELVDFQPEPDPVILAKPHKSRPSSQEPDPSA